ncbi:hypothetical protein QJQ45_015134 [Haematococcus lacustris]|nr:hypothetical protein QJQ45_015134 [Haematococcus lacustris]
MAATGEQQPAGNQRLICALRPCMLRNRLPWSRCRYLTAGISVTTTLNTPQSATASFKAPSHQCTQPAATVDATCSTVTAPWNTLQSSAGAGPSDAAPTPLEPVALAP